MAFLQSGPARQPAFNVPAVVWCLIAALAAAHAARMALGEPAATDLVIRYAFIPARYTVAGTLWDQAIPFVSYMALHGGWTHLVLNSVWLLAFGPIVARRFGAPLFLLFFLLAGVAGAAAFLALNWGGIEPVVGASGAISGLMVAGVRLLPLSFGWTPEGADRPAPILSRQVLSFTLVWVLVNLVAGVLGFPLAGSGAIAWQVHLGGYFTGLVLTGPFDRLRFGRGRTG
jgi:membrane associated rhomboid family serine protease